ncbi:PspC domain-containing protein [Filifactor villosus]|uniref:PspC domain-containing protein n=1 Tax=Filifactor villosus TaxID=29374 RepID=A0ABV9QMP7_9FIRM
MKKLYKSNSDVMIEGVCGGLAEYFDIDSTVIRIIWAFMIATGSGLLLYIIMAVLLPKRPKGSF